MFDPRLERLLESVEAPGLEEAEDTLEALREAGTGVIASPSGSIFQPDGTVKIAVIRPCVSRGARIRGLPPIYTPRMLERDSKVFQGWPMFMDHLTEEFSALEEEEIELFEALKRRQRSVNELGGRVVESWYDPSIRLKEDDQYGHQPGAVCAYVLPQPKPKGMLEADPEILRVSINAYPTGATESTAPWDVSKKGMMIEGIANNPPGSVDWVIRAGAGGRVLRESARFAVSLMDAAYDPAKSEIVTLPTPAPEVIPVVTPPIQEEETVEIKELKDYTPEELRAALRADFPGLLEAEVQATIEAAGYVTADKVTEAVDALKTELVDQFSAALTERDDDTVTVTEALLAERDAYRGLASYAHELIEGADGLTAGFKAELKLRYQLLGTGPTPPLLVEADEDATAEEKVRANVEADIERATALIREAAPDPTVTGQGGSGGEGEDSPKVKKGDNAFVDFMQESGGFESAEDVVTKLRETVEG